MSHLANTTITESGHANVTVHINKKKKIVKNSHFNVGADDDVDLFFYISNLY